MASRPVSPSETARPGGGARLRDIAEAAGVSVSTVSRALRSGRGVDDDLRRKISELAEGLGYVARDTAPKIYTLLTLDLHARDAAGFYAEIIDAMNAEFARQGVPTELVFLRGSPDDAQRIRALAEDGRPCGFALVAVDDVDLIAAASEAGTVMLVNRYDPQMRFDCVAPDNRQGAFLATRHLVERGCRRIAHFTSLQRITIRDRLAGFRAALLEAGLPFEDDLIVDTSYMEPRPACDAALQAIDGGRLTGVDGIFCSNDLIAVGVIEAMAQRGLKTPEDIKVVGFDNTRITARYRPGITTMSVDLDALGRRAARQMLERFEDPSGPAIRQLIGCSLLQRETT